MFDYLIKSGKARNRIYQQKHSKTINYVDFFCTHDFFCLSRNCKFRENNALEPHEIVSNAWASICQSHEEQRFTSAVRTNKNNVSKIYKMYIHIYWGSATSRRVRLHARPSEEKTVARSFFCAHFIKNSHALTYLTNIRAN